MVKQQTEPQHRDEAKPSANDLDEFRTEIEALVDHARGGAMKRNGRDARRQQLRALAAHLEPTLRELEQH